MTKTCLWFVFLGFFTMVKPEGYDTKYDNVDLNEILHSDRLLSNYVNCLMERGRCTPDGSELKANLPDAMTNECRKCSEKQKEGSEKVTHYLIDNKPEWWKELEAKYDKEGTYRRKYLEEKNKHATNTTST